MAALADILAYDEHAPDRFRFAAVPSELPRTFGGQIVAQALMAAARTVGAGYPPHSVHGYFLAPGRPHRPSEHRVERVRDGGRFRVRQVSVTQDDLPTFAMLASFHRGEDGFSHQVDMPTELLPDEIAEVDHASAATVARLADWHDWQLRRVPGDVEAAPVPGAAQRLWIRHRHRLPDDDLVHACALAYLSDMAMLRAARLPHPRLAVRGASLDHAVWFVRPARVDQWLL